VNSNEEIKTVNHELSKGKIGIKYRVRRTGLYAHLQCNFHQFAG
jgi:hypothetical protein